MYFLLLSGTAFHICRLFTKWHRKVNVIFQRLCTETNRAKYNSEIPWTHKQPKPHQNTSENRQGFYRCRTLWSHCQIFHCVSWQFAGGSHSCVSESPYCLTKQTNRHCRCPQRADQECNNASLCYFFHTCKTPGSRHLALQCCNMWDLQGSGLE